MEQIKSKGMKDMTEGPLFSKILLFALPLVATGLLQRLFNIADTIMVGRWGGETVEACELALAAVGSCGSLSYLVISFFFGLSAGAGVLVAHAMGARQYDDVSKITHTSIFVSLITGAFSTLIGVLATRTLLQWTGVSPEIMEEAIPYMRAVFCGMTGVLVYNYAAACLRSAGDSTRPLLFLTASGVLNIIFNFVAVVLLKLGALGVGIATAVSNWASAIFVILYMMRQTGPLHFSFSKLHPDRVHLKKMLTIGLPSGIQGSLFSFSNVIVQAGINSFPVSIVAGNTAAGNLSDIIYSVQNAMYHVALTFIGQHVGAKKYRRMVKCFWLSTVIVATLGLFCGGMVYLFGRPLLSLFAPDNEAAIEAGMVRLAVLSMTYFMCGMQEVGSGTLRALGKSTTAMVIGFFGVVVIRMIWIFTVFKAHHTPVVLYLTYPVSWFFLVVAFYIFCFVEMRRFRRSLEASGSFVE